MEQGELIAAREAFETSRAIREKVLGSEHPSLATTWNELGSLAESLGDFAESVRCMERALAIDLLAIGEDSVAVARRKISLAATLRRDGRALEGFKHLRQAEAVLARHPEAPASTAMYGLRTQCVLEAAVGRHADAVRACQEALTMSEIANGKQHPYTGTVALDLARSFVELKRMAEAFEGFERYLVGEEKLGAAGPDYALALADSAQPLLALGKGKEALERLERAVKLLPIDKNAHPRAGHVLLLLLADALWSSDKARARDLAAQAAVTVGREQVDAWLAKH